MSLALDFDDAARAIAAAVGQFARDRGAEETARAEDGALPRDLWRDLAELGVFTLAESDAEGGPLELAAAFEALGESAFPGPLVATVFASRSLAGDARAAVVGGEHLVALGVPPLLPWAPDADVFLELEGGRAWRSEPRSPVVPVQTLGGEPWGRVSELARVEELDGVPAALALADLARSAWLVGASRALLESAAEHARTRVQFGRPIGEFQAVAHPLAECWIRLAAAETLERLAARALAGDDAAAHAAAGAARLSAVRAGLVCVSACHQTLGALGITLEGPLFHRSRRIRQLASAPPGDEGARAHLIAELGDSGAGYPGISEGPSR